jgi:cytochrome c oxidase subunit 2
MRRLLRKRPALGMALLSGVSTAVGIVIVLVIDWFPAQASTASPQIDTLWDVLMIASVPIFVLVMSVALYSVFAFRAEPGDLSDGEPIHGNTRLEVIWVTIPFIMVSALAVYGWIVLDDIEAKQTDPLIVNVTGQQFAWRFDYPDEGKVKSTQLMLPKDRDVEFRVNTDDVLHDFWVPEFRLKTDAVPGLTTKIRLKPSRIGEYDVVCAELCGIGHSTMRAAVRVVTPEDFDAWIAKEQQSEGDGGAAAAGGDEAGAGRQLFTDTGCNRCHTLADAESTSAVGPGLDDLTANATAYGKEAKQSPEEYVKTSIEDPGAFVVPEFEDGIMPADYAEQLSPEEIDTLAKYLLSVSSQDKP